MARSGLITFLSSLHVSSETAVTSAPVSTTCLEPQKLWIPIAVTNLPCSILSVGTLFRDYVAMQTPLWGHFPGETVACTKVATSKYNIKHEHKLNLNLDMCAYASCTIWLNAVHPQLKDVHQVLVWLSAIH